MKTTGFSIHCLDAICAPLMAMMFVAALSTTSNGFAAEDDVEISITLEKLPKAVRNAVMRAAHDGQIQGIELDIEDGMAMYDIEVTVKGGTVELCFNHDGDLVGIEIVAQGDGETEDGEEGDGEEGDEEEGDDEMDDDEGDDDEGDDDEGDDDEGDDDEGDDDEGDDDEGDDDEGDDDEGDDDEGDDDEGDDDEGDDDEGDDDEGDDEDDDDEEEMDEDEGDTDADDDTKKD